MKTAKILILTMGDYAWAAKIYAVEPKNLGYDIDIACDDQEGWQA